MKKIIKIQDNGDKYVEIVEEEDVVIVSMKNRYMKRGIVDEHGFKQEGGEDCGS